MALTQTQKRWAIGGGIGIAAIAGLWYVHKHGFPIALAEHEHGKKHEHEHEKKHGKKKHENERGEYGEHHRERGHGD